MAVDGTLLTMNAQTLNHLCFCCYSCTSYCAKMHWLKDPIVFPNEFLEELTKLFQANIVMYAYHAWNLHKCNVQFKKQILNFDNLKKKKKWWQGHD